MLSVHQVRVALAVPFDVDKTVLLQAPQHGADLRLASLGQRRYPGAGQRGVVAQEHRQHVTLDTGRHRSKWVR
jgi:hypothetical protein